jgi:hypothetical protein
MSIFNGVGIYVILDVNTPLYGQHIDRSNPGSTYTRDYMEHVFTVIEAFKGYPNLLGFFGGNEIINDLETGNENPPYMRAVQRDMKDYIAARVNRPIPVGYSLMSESSLRIPITTWLVTTETRVLQISSD